MFGVMCSRKRVSLHNEILSLLSIAKVEIRAAPGVPRLEQHQLYVEPKDVSKHQMDEWETI